MLLALYLTYFQFGAYLTDPTRAVQVTLFFENSCSYPFIFFYIMIDLLCKTISPSRHYLGGATRGQRSPYSGLVGQKMLFLFCGIFLSNWHSSWSAWKKKHRTKKIFEIGWLFLILWHFKENPRWPPTVAVFLNFEYLLHFLSKYSSVTYHFVQFWG